MENNWLERFRAEYKPLLKDSHVGCAWRRKGNAGEDDRGGVRYSPCVHGGYFPGECEQRDAAGGGGQEVHGSGPSGAG